jgi:hypothetical protein
MLDPISYIDFLIHFKECILYLSQTMMYVRRWMHSNMRLFTNALTQINELKGNNNISVVLYFMKNYIYSDK